jgi:hypothetical protein
MEEKDTTPSGLSKAGYIQALDNYVYHTNQIAKELENMPGDPIANMLNMMGRGEVFDHFEDRITQMDAIANTIAETYGYTTEELERDMEERFEAHLGEFMLESLLEETQK